MQLESLQFGSAFDVERTDTDLQREVDFCTRFADAGENDLGRIATGPEHALEFTARHDVEARAERREQIQDREIAVRLHRITDAMRQRLQSGVEASVLRGKMRARINVGWRSAALRDVYQRDVFEVRNAVPDRQRVVHGNTLEGSGGVWSGMRSGPFWPQVATISSNSETSNHRDTGASVDKARQYTH